MIQLQSVGPQHEGALLAFETCNRAYFAASISDRGDTFFERFGERHRALIAARDAGSGAFYVLVGDLGAIEGRFNLYDIADGTASVGYRVAQRVAGQGLATGGLRALCQIARVDLGLLALTAAASDDNVASQRVLLNAGFLHVGPTVVAGRQGALFGIDLATL